MALKTYGSMAVDWEQRIDFDRLRRERLQKAKDLLAKSSMGALLCFDMNNVRYLTATHIGTWAQDKANRFTLLPQNDEPILWDFGSAAKHHQLNCPWLDGRSRAGISMLRGAMTPEMGRAEDVAKKIRIELEMRGLHKEPVGIDIIELPVLFALQKEGIKVVDGQELMSEARVIKTQDEIALLNHSATPPVTSPPSSPYCAHLSVTTPTRLTPNQPVLRHHKIRRPLPASCQLTSKLP